MKAIALHPTRNLLKDDTSSSECLEEPGASRRDFLDGARDAFRWCGHIVRVRWAIGFGLLIPDPGEIRAGLAEFVEQ
jgi:hypothetical protein